MQSKIAPRLPVNFTAPGAAGLTSITSMAGEVGEWLFEAHNAVFNSEGLLAPRRLWRIPNPAFYSVPFVSSLIVYPTYAAGVYFVGDTGKIWTYVGLDLTTLGNDGNPPTAWATTVEWKVIYLNRKWYFFAESYPVKCYDPYTASGEFSDVPDAPEFGVAHAAFGRLWTASTAGSDRKLYWSLLLNGKDWTSAGTGSLDLTTYLTEGEVVTAIADFNGFLIVFTNDSILIFQNPFTVPVDNTGAAGTASSMSLKEQINGTGCVGMNAWCNIGEEIIFVSHYGVKSLGRVMDDGGSNPLDVVSPQVAEAILNTYKGSIGTAQNLTWMRLNYHPSFGFVTLETGTSTDAVYLLWVNRPMDRGVYPVTRWGKLLSEYLAGDAAITYFSGLYPTGGFANTGPGITAVLKIYESDGTTVHYHGVAHYGWLNQPDEVVCEERFTFKANSAWLGFGQDPLTKIPKDLKLIYRTPQAPYPEGHAYVSTALTVDFSLRYDYDTQARTHRFTTPLITEDSFDVARHQSEHTVTPIPLAGEGSLVQWEIKAVVDNRAHEAFAVQRAGIQAKIGRFNQGI